MNDARWIVGFVAITVFMAACSDSGVGAPTSLPAADTAPQPPVAATDPVPVPTDSQAPAPAPAPTPVRVSGPITGGAGQATAARVDLGALSYMEQEFFIEGDATSYAPVGTLGADGKWVVQAAATAAYRTRIVVRRPANTADFSGTVVVEWLNVSAGADGDPDWGYTSPELIREGHAWVGVSAQAVGVIGGDALVGGTPNGGALVVTDPARYGTLTHPGDAYSFDIYTQAAQSLLAADGPAPLGGLVPKQIIAIGESQSAFYLTAYVNAIQPLAGMFDGFLVHSRGGGAPTLDAPGGLAMAAADAVAIRDDLAVPVLVFQTETDLTVLGYGYLDQADSDRVKIWQTAGTAHADEYLLAEAYGLGANTDLAALLNCPAPLNSGPQHEVLQAALHHLIGWAGSGTAPPTSPRLQLASVTPPVLARDARGIAIGGIRTPLVDVPVATLSGDMAPGAAGACALFGSTTPFDAATLADLYPTGDAYLQAFRASLQQAVDAGFILADDAPALLTKAEARASTLLT